MPNVRYVCSKFGIDHSTFYRWRARHDSFNKEVLVAIDMGRDRMCEAGEAVLISGIQRGDLNHTKYYLSHNSPRYSSREQHDYLHSINKNLIETLREPTPSNFSEAAFDTLFNIYFTMESVRGEKAAKNHMTPFISYHFQQDSELEYIFYAAYTEWKKDKVELEKRAKAADKKKAESYEREKKEQEERPDESGFHLPD